MCMLRLTSISTVPRWGTPLNFEVIKHSLIMQYYYNITHVHTRGLIRQVTNNTILQYNYNCISLPHADILSLGWIKEKYVKSLKDLKVYLVQHGNVRFNIVLQAVGSSVTTTKNIKNTSPDQHFSTSLCEWKTKVLESSKQGGQVLLSVSSCSKPRVSGVNAGGRSTLKSHF